MKNCRKKADIAYENKKTRLRDEGGNVIIDMTVKNDDGVLSPYSGVGAPTISSDVADFIENSTHSLSPKESYTLRIHSDCIDDGERQEYDTAIREYYTEKYFANRRDQRANRIIALILLAVGILVLSVAFHIEHHVWSEVVDIAAWVLLWEAVDIWVFKIRELNVSALRYLAYMNMNVEYKEITKK